MVIHQSLPFTATTSPSGDIVIFYVGTEPRMTPEQALAFADQLRDLAAGASRSGRREPRPADTGCPDRAMAYSR
ncbi:hypothetical protein OG884_06870 [Streptosporangium sp. NBC_01755]|uniref:hypothetical protein n=1 Tax=unclassified Streptosporangium TaxID=2632669 RepID=UPI002DD82FB7|nr:MULTISPECIES: hypothetical protein [unclassified Streptosporangium]WSA26932.1 hypothetical protein OIE13_03275 [Streptosporangium sp. NBC_01810]WSD01643.1 hypothetical protein OG884_06870 [Streptosporangium sp. NBC_01755]